MKKLLSVLIAAILMMSLTGCSLFSSGASEDAPTGGAIEITDTYTHIEPEVEYAARYAYTSGKNCPDLVDGFKSEYGVDLIQDFLILYGDKDDRALCMYEYYVFATPEDAKTAQEFMGADYFAIIEGNENILLAYSDQEFTQMVIDMNVQYASLTENTCSAYAYFMKDIDALIEIQ